LLPAISSSDDPTGIGAALIITLVPFAVLFVTALLAVSLTSLTVAVTSVVCMLDKINPRTTVVVLLAAVYTTYGVPLLAGSAAKFTTLNVFAILFFLYYPNAIAKAVASSAVAAPMYVLKSLTATCTIVPLSFNTTLSASTIVVLVADVSPSSYLVLLL